MDSRGQTLHSTLLCMSTQEIIGIETQWINLTPPNPKSRMGLPLYGFHHSLTIIGWAHCNLGNTWSSNQIGSLPWLTYPLHASELRASLPNSPEKFSAFTDFPNPLSFIMIPFWSSPFDITYSKPSEQHYSLIYLTILKWMVKQKS